MGAALLSVLIMAAGWFLLISPSRGDAADLKDQAASAQNQAQLLQQQIAQLKAQYGDLPKRRAELAAIQRQLPANAEIPDLVRDLRSYASEAGVDMVSIAPGTPAFVGDAGAAAGQQGGQVVQIPLDITINGDYFEDSLFVKYLQTRLERVMLISNLSVSQGSDTSGTTTTDSTTATGTTATPSPSAAASQGTTPVTSKTLAISAEVFVLPAAGTSLADVAKDAAAATSGATASGTTTQ